MKNLKNEKGITLVALVITIIVLLILAAVSLSLVMGGDGVFQKAQKATTNTNANVIKEQVEYSVTELMGSYYGKYAGEPVDPELSTPAEATVGEYIYNNLANPGADKTGKRTLGDITIEMTDKGDGKGYTINAYKKTDESNKQTATLSTNGGLSWGTAESGS